MVAGNRDPSRSAFISCFTHRYRLIHKHLRSSELLPRSLARRPVVRPQVAELSGPRPASRSVRGVKPLSTQYNSCAAVKVRFDSVSGARWRTVVAHGVAQVVAQAVAHDDSVL